MSDTPPEPFPISDLESQLSNALDHEWELAERLLVAAEALVAAIETAGLEQQLEEELAVMRSAIASVDDADESSGYVAVIEKRRRQGQNPEPDPAK